MLRQAFWEGDAGIVAGETELDAQELPSPAIDARNRSIDTPVRRTSRRPPPTPEASVTRPSAMPWASRAVLRS